HPFLPLKPSQRLRAKVLNNQKEIKMTTEMKSRGAKDSAAGRDVDLHLYAPFEGLHGTEPIPLVAAIPFYSDPEMTDALGTLTIVGVTIPSDELPSYFYCRITFGWHGKDETLAAADTILTRMHYLPIVNHQ
ncbi:MAG: hypothetical protein AAF391_03395, partial [Bacteroidota bacterium]